MSTVGLDLASAHADSSSDTTNHNHDIDDNLIDSPSSPRNVRIPLRNQLFDNQSHATASGSSSALQSLTSASTLSTLDSSNTATDTKLDSPRSTVAQKGLLRDSVFEHWKDDSASMDTDSPEEMQKKDPLGTQIWKLYHKTRGQLPNSERLENLTWRMMSMNLRKRQMEQKGYVAQTRPRDHTDMLRLAKTSIPAKSNQPSGIAQQLRQQSIDQSKQDDHMNLDDFIVPSSIGSPAGVSPALSGPVADIDEQIPGAALISGLPINRRQQQIQAEELSLSRASAPSTGFQQSRSKNEFDYVPRHVRKTSIDERRVCFYNTTHNSS